MPDFNYNDIKENTKKGENYSPNRAKTSPNTYSSLKKAAEMFTKMIPEEAKDKLVETVAEELVSYLNVPEKTETKSNGEKPILLRPEMMTTFIKNAAKEIAKAGKSVNIKEYVEEEKETAPITDNVETPKEENIENTENNGLFNFNLDAGADNTQTEMNDASDEKTLDEEPQETKNDEFNFDSMFNFGQSEPENSDNLNNVVTEEKMDVEGKNSFNTEETNTSNYVTEMQQSLAPFENSLFNNSENKKENQYDVASNNDVEEQSQGINYNNSASETLSALEEIKQLRDRIDGYEQKFQENTIKAEELKSRREWLSEQLDEVDKALETNNTDRLTLQTNYENDKNAWEQYASFVSQVESNNETFKRR